ncbi:MAG: lactate dehydrogenase, partial [Planctomycetia bacterium]|nr:lactate dehydrogenase [Planctomycetia bacterium]
ESLSTFHAHVAEAMKGLSESAGRLLPGPWERRRREVREQGVPVASEVWGVLARRAENLGVTPPAPLA